MRLPDYAAACIQALEAAGFAAYAVGGCVRDALLGLEPQDYDLCTAATPEETERVFSDYPLVLAGKKHGTVGVVTQGRVVEITTFRTEGGYQDNRRPDWVEFVTDIDADLARRDFTVNAMAYSPTRGLRDPFGGQKDLENRVLRAVGDPQRRFEEDSLRILRGARFAVKYRLEPEPETERAMISLPPLMDNLARERVFEELCKLLPLVTAGDLLRYAPILTQVLPELAPTLNFDQHNPHHAFDLYTHIARVTGAVETSLPLRWAALLHDVGKPATFTLDAQGRGHFYGHAKVGAALADGALRRLKAPNALRERVVLLIAQHMTPLEPDRKLLRRRLSRLGSEAVWQLLELQRRDMGGKGAFDPELPYYDRIAALLREIEAEQPCLTVSDLAIGGHELMALGFRGKAIGQCLNALLEQVLEETLPNESAALLAAAQKYPKL